MNTVRVSNPAFLTDTKMVEFLISQTERLIAQLVADGAQPNDEFLQWNRHWVKNQRDAGRFDSEDESLVWHTVTISR
jgi:hypothetical protein